MNDKPSLITRLLGSDKPSPAQEIRQALAQIDQRARHIDQRLAAIQRGSAINGGHGPERRRALETGTPDELIEMDREFERLIAERDQQLPAQAEALRKRLEAAEADEARERLPTRIKAIPKALDDYERAAAALKQAKAALDDAVSNVIVDRRTAGNDAPAVAEEHAQRVATVRGFGEETASPYSYNRPRAQLFADLGCELPLKARPDHDAHPKRRGAFMQEEGDQQADSGRNPDWLEPGGMPRDKIA